ncbi:SDR family oxidoreductase [Lentzea sp.]|uniref:SDR family oxidoreductase n=1 Tax=Lentzea sp. TaxID=56099 RepID=UPI002BBBB6F2|nr:SDR family oxidoreductase [Lentzea sp.]HUQ59452.1 SDR family oxidoreductase [Lentzea sp.]
MSSPAGPSAGNPPSPAFSTIWTTAITSPSADGPGRCSAKPNWPGCSSIQRNDRGKTRWSSSGDHRQREAPDDAVELIGRNVTAVQVATAEQEELFDEETKAAFEPLVPRGEMGRPEEIATAALFLASDDSGYVNGLEPVTDGGTTAI